MEYSNIIIPSGDVIHINVQRQTRSNLTSRQFITCFRCGEQGHYRCECMTWKTRHCSHWDRSKCENSLLCPFAHGQRELRFPWVSKCIRIIKRDGGIVKLGCGQLGHTYRTCPQKPIRFISDNDASNAVLGFPNEYDQAKAATHSLLCSFDGTTPSPRS